LGQVQDTEPSIKFDPKIPPPAITDAEFKRVLQAQGSSRARAARYHIIELSNQNPAYARKMSERLQEILQRFKDDWNALEREVKRFIDE
jgi:type I restriction enzyme, R subunit